MANRLRRGHGRWRLNVTLSTRFGERRSRAAWGGVPREAPGTYRRFARIASMQMLPDLQGRVALVTGAARRTGRVIATKLAAAGASVLVNAMSSRAEAEALVADIEREHGAGRAMAHIADVSDPQAVRAMVAACVERFGGLDILVNNASIRLHAALDATTPEQWRRVLQVTLDGSFYCAQAAAPHLSRSGQGVVIKIGRAHV